MPHFHSTLNYQVWEGEKNGNPVTYRGITEPNEECASFNHRISISWQYDAENSGFPTHEVNEAQKKLEDLLDPLEAKDSGVLYLVIFGDNKKEWHWCVADINEWMTGLNKQLESHDAFPIQIAHHPNDEWAHHQAFVRWVTGAN